jgi:hypothetical protein
MTLFRLDADLPAAVFTKAAIATGVPLLIGKRDGDQVDA